MGELGNIEKLDLGNCSLTGLCGMDFFAFCMMVNQPTTSFMTLITWLSTGEIPSEIIKLVKLEKLDLSYNKFTGQCFVVFIKSHGSG